MGQKILDVIVMTRIRLNMRAFLLKAYTSFVRSDRSNKKSVYVCLGLWQKKIRNLVTYFLALMILSGTGLSFAADSADELYRQGRFGEAEKAYAQGDMDHPKKFRYRYNRGCAAYQNGDYKGASAAFSSIYRRSEDESLRYKAAYNLGNTAFKQGDFESAIQYYKTALVYDSENKDARYNLELALREREKQKKEQQKQEDKKQQGSSEDQKQKQKDQQKEKGEQKSKEGQQQQEDKSETDKDQGKEGNNQQQAGQNKAEKKPQDLAGKLSPRQAMEEGKKEEQPSEESKAGIDKKRAEALLDNIQEDPSRILRFQIPRDKRGGVGSGKNW